MKDSPSSLIPEQCIYKDLVPLDYVSLDSIIYEMKHDKAGKIQNTSIRDKQNKLKPYSAPWMIRQIWNHPKEGELQLKIYAHDTHKEQVDQTLIQQLNDLEEEDALWYLRKIKEPRWINANGHREINLEMTITTLDTEEKFDVKALLDSGCMSSAISKRFVKEHQINTIKLPRAITAMNADGTINAGGKITDMVRLKIKIQDHEETMELTVADIGKKDIFIGHDWLQHHNPEIDWQDKKIKFSRCPGICYQESGANEPEDEIDENKEINQEDERLLAIEIGQPELDRFKI